jgi:integrase
MADRLTNSSINALPPKARRYEISDIDVRGLRLRVSPDGSKTYYILYRHDGQRRRFRLGRHGELTVASARKLARAKLGEVAGGTDVQAERKAARVQAEKDKASTLGGFLERHYWPHVEAEHKRGDLTRSVIEREFGHLLDKQLTDITPLVMTRWRRNRLGDGLDASTLNRARGALSGVLSRAVEWGYLDRHPFANRQFKRLSEDNRPKVRYLSKEEERRFRLALRDRDERIRAERLSSTQWHRARGLEPLPEFTGRFVDHLEPLLLTLRLTGMRPAEAFSLDWSDVDLGGRQLTVAGVTTKTKQTRHIPLSAELHGILNDWAQQTESEGLVFPSPAGGKLVSITKGWSNIRDAAGLKEFRLYDLRHSFASSLVQAGVDLNTVRELLGHTDYGMTLRYAHLAPDTKAAAVGVLDRLEVAHG